MSTYCDYIVSKLRRLFIVTFGASCTGLAVHSYFRSHYLGKFSHLKLELSSVYLQHSFLSGFFRVCQGTIISTLGTYSHLWTKGKRVQFSNFQLQMFKNWQISLSYCYLTKFYTGMLRPERPTCFSFICHSVLRYPFWILSTDELYTFHIPSLKHYFLLATVNALSVKKYKKSLNHQVFFNFFIAIKCIC